MSRKVMFARSYS